MGSYTFHKDYKTCNYCGSNLDYGERCDCLDEQISDRQEIKEVQAPE